MVEFEGFQDHRNNIYVLNNDYQITKSICDQMFDKYKTSDFVWSNQTYTSIAASIYKQLCGYLPESQYETKTIRVINDFYPEHYNGVLLIQHQIIWLA